MSNPLNPNQLKVFVAIARQGSLRKASVELNLTPSALSHSLKALEEDLQCPLFIRSSRTISLTQVGKSFLPEAEYLLERLESVRHRLSSWTDWRRGRLRIGGSPTACHFLFPSLIREFKESFPHITIKIAQAPARRLLKMVEEGSLDLAVCVRNHQPDDLVCTPLADDRLTFLVHPLHPWAKKGRVPREEIPSQRYILTESHSFTQELITDYFRAEGIRIDPFIEISNEEVIKQLVRLDIGIGICPAWIAAEEIERGLLKPLPMGKRELKRHWVIYRLPEKKLSFAEHLFQGICQSVSRNLMHPDRHVRTNVR